jgi:ribosomal protein S18 acetylase RimI-like enzyme
LLSDHQRLAQIQARRKAGIADLGAELRQRIADFGSIRLDTPERRAAFAEVLAPFEIAPYRLVDVGSSVDAANETIQIDAWLIDVRGQSPEIAAKFVRGLNLDRGEAEHAWLTVEPAFEGRAIAPRLMLASFALYDELGVTAVNVHAGLQDGRFYWSGRVGYSFRDERQARFVERWATFVLGALRISFDLDGVEEPQQWALLGTAEDCAPTVSFTELANVLPPIPVALVDPNRTGVIGFTERAAVTDSEFVDPQIHLQLVARGARIDWLEQVPLGRAIMLAGPDWYGTFDLTDPVRRQSYESAAQQRVNEVTTAGVV